jgi:S-adenosylmethionine hydrolase
LKLGTCPCIALLTDFGTSDPYVGIMTINPDARIVDVNHQCMPHSVEAAGLHLRSCVPYFPTGTLFVVVVDPGVGTSRRILYAESARHRFLAPDNGVLSLLETRDRVRTARSVTNRAFLRSRLSNTFHGRDVFAPVAGWLSLKTDPSKLGPRVKTIVKSSWRAPKPRKDGSILGTALHADRFGNLITDIPVAALKTPSRSVVTLEGREIHGISRTYSDRRKGELIAVIGSMGTVEISVNQGSAVRHLGALQCPVAVYPPGVPPENPEPDDFVYVLESNLDNVSGEAVGGLYSRLFECGALDVWCTPIQMKKSRPGVKLSVMVHSGDRTRIAHEILRHAPTFGVRFTQFGRLTLSRRVQPVKTKYGKIRIKVGSLDGEAIRAAPEYEDVAAAAKRSKVPFDVVHLAASEAGRKFLT